MSGENQTSSSIEWYEIEEKLFKIQMTRLPGPTNDM